jgi:hypothetical protein
LRYLIAFEATFLAFAPVGCGSGGGAGCSPGCDGEAIVAPVDPEEDRLADGVSGPDCDPGDCGPADCDVDDDGYLSPRCAGDSEADCDDADPTVHPQATEELDGVDDDCDGVVDEGTAAWDIDGDCFCVALACTGSVNGGCPSVTGGDCDDADPANFPGNVEVCDGADNDCDKVADNGLPVLSWWADVDADGFGSQVAAPTLTCGGPPPGTVANNTDCDDLRGSVGPFMVEIECDGLDNDCDPSTPDGVDHDRDGVDHCFDCDDDDPGKSPANEEVCDDRDNDCDGDADDGLDFDDYWPDSDRDGYGDEDADEVELCEDVPGWVDNDDDCNDGNGWVNPSATEWPCDGVDNDCDDGDRCP